MKRLGRMPSSDRGGRKHVAKRGVDVIVAVTVLVVSAPLQLLAALAILIEDGRPVFYCQTRTGRAGVPFRIIKFRSMRVNDTPPAEMPQVRPEDPLVTRVGRFLRTSRIDELPQLVNVVNGHMSLVGPRPTLPEQVAHYDQHQLRRLEVRPGLTGWAQVNGNSSLSWPERIALDVWYVDHQSLKLDVVILARTLSVIVRGERANARALAEAHHHAKSPVDADA